MIKVENDTPLNDETIFDSTAESELPITYKDMTNKEEDVKCTIDFDEDNAGKYLAIFVNKTIGEQKIAQLQDLKHVNNFRNELCLLGWRMYKEPTIEATHQVEEKLKSGKYRRELKKADAREEKHKRKEQLRKERLKLEANLMREQLRKKMESIKNKKD